MWLTADKGLWQVLVKVIKGPLVESYVYFRCGPRSDVEMIDLFPIGRIFHNRLCVITFKPSFSIPVEPIKSLDVVFTPNNLRRHPGVENN